MFNKGINLKKKSWHIRLIKWLYGTEYNEYNNFCPYFWLLIGTLFFFPAILGLKLIIKLFYDIRDNKKKINNTKIICIGRFMCNVFSALTVYSICMFFTLGISVVLYSIIVMICENLNGLLTFIIMIFLPLMLLFFIFLFLFLIVTICLALRNVKDSDNITIQITMHLLKCFEYPFVKIFNIIKKMVLYIVKAIKKFYNKTCPLINWK